MNITDRIFSIFKIKSGSFFENSSSILLTRMSFSCSSLVIAIFIARNLGADQLGSFSIVMGLCAIFQYISILGYDTVVIREIAQDQNKGGWLIGQGIMLGVLSSSAGVLLMGLSGKLLNYPPAIMTSIMISSMVLLPCFLNVTAENIFIGLKKARYAFYTALIRESMWLFLSVWGICIDHHINVVIEAFIVSRIAGVVLMAIFLRRENILWWKNIHWQGLKEIFGLIPAFLVINLLSNVLLEVDVIILSKLVPVADVGYYNVAKKILRVSFILIFSMVSASFPLIVETMQKTQQQVLSYFKEISFRMLLVSLAIAAIIFVLAHALIGLFFGSAFIPTVRITHVLIWKIVPLGLAYLWSRFLMAANQQNKDVIALMIALPLFLFIGTIFVKWWGTIGLAIADVLTLSILASIHLYFVNQTIFSSTNMKATKNPLH